MNLYLHNDEVNSFDKVVLIVMGLLKYEDLQAEQLVTLAHYKNKFPIKQSNYLELESLKGRFEEYGIKTTIE